MDAHPEIPFFYRLTFHYFEPFFATLGGLSMLFAPQVAIDGQTPVAGLHYARAATQLAPLTAQISGGWLLLAFHDIFTLRFTNDPLIWALVMAGGSISDVVYTYSVWLEHGTQKLVDPRLWSAADAFLVLSTVYPMLSKFAFLLGIGLRRGTKSKRL